MAFSIGNTTQNQTWAGTGTAAVTITLTAGSVVLILAHQSHATITETVSNVTSANLTFSKRSAHARVNSGSDTVHQNMEVWWAPSSSALTSEVITVHSSGTPTIGSICAAECKGPFNINSPWDGNVSLPAGNDGTGSHASVVVSIDTPTSEGFIFVGADGAAASISTAGFVQRVAATNLGTLNSESRIWDAPFTSSQSSVTWGASTNSNQWMLIGDAFAISTINPVKGTYSLTGEVVTFNLGKVISPTEGTYTLTGKATTLTSSRSISPVQGVYTLTGKAVSFAAGKLLSAIQGVYTLTGEAVTLTKVATKILAAAQGIYTLTGKAVSFSAAKALSAVHGVYNLTGFSTGTAQRLIIPGTRGIYSLVGSSVNLLKTASFSTFTPSVETDYDTYSLWSAPTPGMRRTRVKSFIVPKAITHLTKAVNNAIAEMTSFKFINPSSGSYAIAGYPQTLSFSGSTPKTGMMGMNISQSSASSGERIHLNILKNAALWYIISGPDTDPTHIQVDANGYPTTMTLAVSGDISPGFETHMEYALTPYPGATGGTYPSGNYVLLYDGTGTVVLDGDTTFVGHGGTGRDIYNVPFGSTSTILLRITATSSPPNNIRNIRVVNSPDSTTSVIGVNETALNNGEKFNPDFITRFSGFKCIRTMQAQNTIRAPTVNWANRTLESYYNYTGVDVPVETLCSLCNELNTNLWINVPHLASDDYITQMAILVKSNLNSNLKVYVEFGNEWWNTSAFGPLWSSIMTVAEAALPLLTPDGFSPGFEYCVVRSARTAVLWKAVWTGADRARLICVGSGQNGNTGRNQNILATTATTFGTGFEATGGDPTWFTGNTASNWDVFTTAPYFGEDVPNGTTLDQLFTQINTGGYLAGGWPGGSIQQAVDFFTRDSVVAQEFNIPLVVYESGQDYTSLGNPTLTTLYAAANRDSRMGAAYTNYFTKLFNINNDLIVHYAAVGPENEFGSWGCLENTLQTASPKYNALVGFL